jgi:hypothetical protein
MIGKGTTNNSLAKYNRSQMQACITVASKQRAANPSDPYTYDRVMTHLLGGLCMISDYEVEFRNEPRTTETGKPYNIQIPCNQKRP